MDGIDSFKSFGPNNSDVSHPLARLLGDPPFRRSARSRCSASSSSRRFAHPGALSPPAFQPGTGKEMVQSCGPALQPKSGPHPPPPISSDSWASPALALARPVHPASRPAVCRGRCQAYLDQKATRPGQTKSIGRKLDCNATARFGGRILGRDEDRIGAGLLEADHVADGGVGGRARPQHRNYHQQPHHLPNSNHVFGGRLGTIPGLVFQNGMETVWVTVTRQGQSGAALAEELRGPSGSFVRFIAAETGADVVRAPKTHTHTHTRAHTRTRHTLTDSLPHATHHLVH